MQARRRQRPTCLGGADANASGSSSANTIQIMHPPAKPSATGRIACSARSRRSAGERSWAAAQESQPRASPRPEHHTIPESYTQTSVAVAAGRPHLHTPASRAKSKRAAARPHPERLHKHEGGHGHQRLRQAGEHGPEERAARADTLADQHRGLGQALGDVVDADGQRGQHALGGRVGGWYLKWGGSGAAQHSAGFAAGNLVALLQYHQAGHRTPTLAASA